MRGVLLAALLLAIPAAAAGSPGEPVAAFVTDGDRSEIVLADIDGSVVANLTARHPDRTVSDSQPSWSPDGSRLAFVSRRGDRRDVFVMDADGRNRRALTTDGGPAASGDTVSNLDPAWAAGGIAFLRKVHHPVGIDTDELWLVQPDGTGVRQLTHDGRLKGPPRWSPEGRRIAYTRDGVDTSPPEEVLFVIDIAEGAPRRLTPPGVFDVGPVWSPDGTRIALSGLKIVNADGNGRRTLTVNAGDPAWSPDGDRIAYAVGVAFPKYGSRYSHPVLVDVHAIGVDGSRHRRLTGYFAGGYAGLGFGEHPSWWPDGSRLFFTAARGRNPRTTWVMNADGSCERRFGGAVLLDPVWRPGARITSSPLRCVDLRVVTSVDRTRLRAGRTTRFRVAVENDGNQTAAGVQLTVKPASARLTSGSASCRRGTCTVASIPAQAQAKLVFAVRVPRGKLQLRASVTP